VRLLVLGGTAFLGRAVVEAALARGDKVTLFNRGVTNPELFPEAERLRGDLGSNVDALSGGVWDAVIDLDPVTLPRHVRGYASLLAEAAGRFVFVSTISVYADVAQPIDERSAVHEPPDPEPEEFVVDDYGGLKVGCERAVQATFGERCVVVRPGLIAGPHDPTERFTYWPRRLAEGGDVLAPGSPAQPIQLIDVRDLGTWLVAIADSDANGVFNATGPAEPLTLGGALDRIGSSVDLSGRLVWVDDDALLEAGVQPWSEVPLWLPGEQYAGLLRADVTRALAAGLTLRPLEETARDTLAWSRDAGEQRQTLERAKEREILSRR
jgi:2'-hydroxyisoflavone reductase